VVLVPAVPVTVMPPVAGTVKLTAQLIEAPTASGLGAGLGVHTATAPAGTLVTLQLGLAAGLGPLLVQVMAPLAFEPAGGLLGKPLATATMSACGAIVSGLMSVLLAGSASAVEVPAVVVMFKLPPAPKLAGALKVLVQVMLEPTASGSGAGLGAQLCVAPAGKPLNAQVGAAAALGPALLHTPLTVTGWPAAMPVGTVVVARMSACSVTPTTRLSTLFVGTGSAVLEPAAPTSATLPVVGAV
jgi:hypothetical protein